MDVKDDINRPGWQAARMVSDEERARIGNEVAAARQAYGWSKEAASRAAGVDSQTWTKIENGGRVRPDRLAAVRRYVQQMTAATSSVELEAITDDQLINELARRLARTGGEAASDGPPKTRPVVREVPTTGQYAVAVTTEEERRKQKRGPRRAVEEHHPNGG